MIMKRGVSLVVLIITIIILIILTGVSIIGIGNGIDEAKISDFVTEISVITDKIKQYYLLTGKLPVVDREQYTASEILNKTNSSVEYQMLGNEITLNSDENNIFLVVDLNKIEVETDERGVTQQNTDIFLVATNTLNVYYLKGVLLEDVIRFSLVTLAEKNIVDNYEQQDNAKVEYNSQLSLAKNTNIWTSDIVITVKSILQSDEVLQYSIAGADFKNVINKQIVINTNTMTSNEKNLFSTNKNVIVNKLINNNVVETKTIDISNLDIDSPTLGTLEIIDGSNANYNIVKVNASDNGISGIKHIYYDYNDMLVGGLVLKYYNNISKFTKENLMELARTTVDGNIKLDKHIKSIAVMAIDNARNTSNIQVYTIPDDYVISK